MMKYTKPPLSIQFIAFIIQFQWFKYIKLLVFMVMILVIGNGCKKENAGNYRDNQIYSPPKITNTAPTVSAGLNSRILFPADSAVLNGIATDAENNIVSYSWQKFSGPDSFVIEHPDSLVTKVQNLQKGIYEFELTVSDKEGLTSKSIVKVMVYETPKIGNNELILMNQSWDCFFGCWLDVKRFDSLVPAGTPFRIYVKRNNSTTWAEAIPHIYQLPGDTYTYGIDRGDLSISSNLGVEEKDTPDIKINY